MINNIEQLIEQYVLGTLPSEEVVKLEQHISSSPELKQQVEMQKNVMEAIKQKGRLQMKANLSKLNPKAGISLTKKLVIAAATITTATVVGLGIYSNDSQEQQYKAPTISTVTSNETVTEQDVSTNSSIEEAVTNIEKVENIETEQKTINSTETESSLITSSTIALPVSKQVEEKITDAIVESNHTTKFDPASEDIEEDEENSIGNNQDIETDQANTTETKSTIPVNTIEDSKIQGFIYDGNSIGISGSYKTTYTVSQKEGMLIFEYDNKFYKIIESNKIERWKDHEITDQKIINKL